MLPLVDDVAFEEVPAPDEERPLVPELVDEAELEEGDPPEVGEPTTGFAMQLIKGTTVTEQTSRLISNAHQIRLPIAILSTRALPTG